MRTPIGSADHEVDVDRKRQGVSDGCRHIAAFTTDSSDYDNFATVIAYKVEYFDTRRCLLRFRDVVTAREA